MAKRRLTDLAKEYEISFDEAMDIAFNHLTEESITGRGKNTWIDEVGQELFDDNVPIKDVQPQEYRGRVRNLCPHPLYAMVHVKEKNGVVKMKIAPKLRAWVKRFSMVRLKQINDDTYEQIVPKLR
jgi:hypothetical protein